MQVAAEELLSAESLLAQPPFELSARAKRAFFVPRLAALTQWHYERCAEYRTLVDRLFGGERACDFTRLEDAPFLPVSLFKTRQLKSVPDSEVQKVLTSSGTTGQQVSRIYLDKTTAQFQSIVLVKLMQHFLGKQRLPMLIIDHPGVIKDRSSFSARGAGILGMSQFGRQPCYVLRDDMSVDLETVQAYIAAAGDQPVFLFGFTFMVWQHFVRALEERGETLNLPHGTLMHGGGWKKLQDQAVDASEFRQRWAAVTGGARALNFYGMVEQVGSVFFENDLHHLQTPALSDVIVRDPVTFEPLPFGKTGVIQVLSLCPRSYPGHSLLTEDLGTIRGDDLAGAGLLGRSFNVHGRLPRSEVRGCSDTYQAPTSTPAAVHRAA